jgi:phage baseplate assembly protein W
MANIDEIYKTDLAFVSDLVVTPAGDLETVSGLNNYRDALLRRLITTPGSLIHRPDYGVGIKRWSNAINSISERQKIAVAIKEQFERDPRTAKVISVGISSDNERPETIKINVKVDAVGFGEQQFTFVPFGGIV